MRFQLSCYLIIESFSEVGEFRLCYPMMSKAVPVIKHYHIHYMMPIITEKKTKS